MKNVQLHLFNCVYLGLQMTEVELDARVTGLEKNTGGGTENGKGI